MATSTAIVSESDAPLAPGDRLSRDEFERRYERMPHLKKAELIESIVYMPSPVRAENHGIPHINLAGWLTVFSADTTGVQCADNASVRLDLDNEPQPDLVLFKLPQRGGRAQISADDYLEGAPELVIEIVGASRAYDLHQKKEVYRRNGVREYLAVIIGEKRVVWWELREGDYREIQADSEGLLKSGVFPGLWLDAHAVLADDKRKLLSVLRRGLESPEHQAFCSQEV